MTNSGTAEGIRSWPRAALIAVALITGVRMIADGTGHGGAPPHPSATDAFGTSAAQGSEHAVQMLAPSAPTRIEIPAVDVDAPVSGLGRAANNTLRAPPPDNANLAGWDKAGVTPGSTGTAVIAGHVDTLHGPAVFYGLGALHRGDKVDVGRTDGRTAVFTIDAIEEYEKGAFPSEKVYRQATRAELRLVTCGGTYTERNGYSGNVVVYAHLTQVR